jgi:hypothetical protein
MNNFKDFGIKTTPNSFVGDKIKINKILNLEVKIISFKIEDSKVKAGTKLLTIQLQKNDDNHIVFTGSKNLIEQINQVPKDKFPFTTKIVNINEYYEFT